jgi:hypothetical protein
VGLSSSFLLVAMGRRRERDGKGGRKGRIVGSCFFLAVGFMILLICGFEEVMCSALLLPRSVLWPAHASHHIETGSYL